MIARNTIVFLLLFLVSCSGAYKQSLDFDPAEPLRVAVLPFYQVDADGKIITIRDDVYILDHIPGVSEKVEKAPAKFVQDIFETELQQSGFDLVPTLAVESTLMHGGYRTKRGIDLPAVLSASPRELCRVIQCDAVLYGKVTRWDRSYYVLQSVSTVGLEVKLVRAVDGKVLFEAASEDSDSRGLSKGPTGYTSLVLEPIRGLDSGIIVELASNVVRETVKPLKSQRDDEAAATPPPVIFSASHDAVSGKLDSDGRLVVLSYATPKSSGSFSVGRAVRNVPMFEVSPGHFMGEYFPVAGESFDAQTVMVRVEDIFGRFAEQRATEIQVSVVSK